MSTTKPNMFEGAAVTEPGNCTLHGPYECKVVMVSRVPIRSRCPKCDVIYTEAEALRERAQADSTASTRLEAAAIPLRFSPHRLSDFVVSDPAQKKAHAVASKYVQQWRTVRKKGACLVLCGKFGTGKTMLACAIASEVVEQHGATALYATALNVVRRIKETWRGGDHKSETEKQAIGAFVKPDLLVLDEVGVQFGSEAERLLLFDVLNGRYEEVKPTIVISNDDTTGMEKYVGARVMDRLKEGGGYVLPFDWKSYRDGGE